MSERITLLHGDCLEVMPTLAADSVDSIVTDPPYGLSFMGKNWDHGVPGQSFWVEALRVAKPGAHLLAFGGTRTYHRLACAIEDAGWEIRDCVMWVYGSGFPKSLDVSKAIDKAAGARGHDSHGFNAAGVGISNGGSKFRSDHPEYVKPEGITDAARQWSGWGTALKPAYEPIIVARKPLDGTVAANVLKHGTGAINVDGCRIEGVREKTHSDPRKAGNGWNASPSRELPPGRWPANLIHDGSAEVVGLFPSTGASGQGGGIRKTALGRMNDDAWQPRETIMPGYGDSGSAARFFYCAKASKADRDEGLEDFALRSASECCEDREPGSAGLDNPRAGAGRTSGARNVHPTVKPTSLMRYLCRLVTPPGGIVLDPFMGSGSTGKGAVLEGFRFIGIEREAEYLEIARARINHQLEKVLKEQEKQGPEQLNLID
jgi:site-specific DNA-methyltransferase (adenine-specific)